MFNTAALTPAVAPGKTNFSFTFGHEYGLAEIFARCVEKQRFVLFYLNKKVSLSRSLAQKPRVRQVHKKRPPHDRCDYGYRSRHALRWMRQYLALDNHTYDTPNVGSRKRQVFEVEANASPVDPAPQDDRPAFRMDVVPPTTQDRLIAGRSRVLRALRHSQADAIDKMHHVPEISSISAAQQKVAPGSIAEGSAASNLQTASSEASVEHEATPCPSSASNDSEAELPVECPEDIMALCDALSLLHIHEPDSSVKNAPGLVMAISDSPSSAETSDAEDPVSPATSATAHCHDSPAQTDLASYDSLPVTSILAPEVPAWNMLDLCDALPASKLAATECSIAEGHFQAPELPAQRRRQMRTRHLEDLIWGSDAPLPTHSPLCVRRARQETLPVKAFKRRMVIDPDEALLPITVRNTVANYDDPRPGRRTATCERPSSVSSRSTYSKARDRASPYGAYCRRPTTCAGSQKQNEHFDPHGGPLSPLLFPSLLPTIVSGVGLGQMNVAQDFFSTATPALAESRVEQASDFSHDKAYDGDDSDFDAASAVGDEDASYAASVPSTGDMRNAQDVRVVDEGRDETHDGDTARAAADEDVSCSLFESSPPASAEEALDFINEAIFGTLLDLSSLDMSS